MHRMKSLEIQVATIHDVKRPGFRHQNVRTLTSCCLPSEMWMKVGMLPRKSSSVLHLDRRLGRAKRSPREGGDAPTGTG